jgi:hypothetical protein
MGLQNLISKRVKFVHPPAIVNLTFCQSIHPSISLSLSLSLWSFKGGKEKKRKVQSDCLTDYQNSVFPASLIQI